MFSGMSQPTETRMGRNLEGRSKLDFQNTKTHESHTITEAGGIRILNSYSWLQVNSHRTLKAGANEKTFLQKQIASRKQKVFSKIAKTLSAFKTQLLRLQDMLRGDKSEETFEKH